MKVETVLNLSREYIELEDALSDLAQYGHVLYLHEFTREHFSKEIADLRKSISAAMHARMAELVDQLRKNQEGS